MNKKRIKKNLAPVLDSRDAAEAAVDDLARLANERRAVAAELDAQIIALKENYGSKLSALDDGIKEHAANLEAWALAHPELFAKRKSVEFINGTVGFRTGTPKLALLSRAWNWDTVTEAVQRILPNFIRPKPEVDKEGIIASREDVEEHLPLVGLKITQAESFYVEPRLTE